MIGFPNSHRGEVVFEVDGKAHKLCLTLGALASLETAFAASSLNDLSQKFANISAQDLLIVLAILLEAGGASYNVDTLSKANIEIRSAAIAIAETFQAAFSDGK
jgi:hypothetical protein